MSPVHPCPIIEALPPATDYLTYLTLLEYNVTTENVSTLNEVLQDVGLTTNIGWDLVQILLPLLPHSRECLRTIARVGNPREVLLKATESLRLIATEDEDFEEVTYGAADKIADHDQPNLSTGYHSDVTDGENVKSGTPPSVLKFEVLLDMLIVLHARIKTRHPSRFLATTLQAVLAACSTFTSHFDRIIAGLISLVDALIPNEILDSQHREDRSKSYIDPEAHDAARSTEDLAIQTRLLLSFVTFVVEVYSTHLQSYNDVPGWCWSNRMQEILLPEKVVPGRMTYNEMFERDEGLRNRATYLDSLAHLAKRLGSTSSMLKSAAFENSVPTKSSLHQLEEDPPATAEEIPLSSSGALLLTAQMRAKDIFSHHGVAWIDMNIFPEHCQLTTKFVGSPESGGLTSAGTETEALLDSILFLGLIALQNDRTGETQDDEEFHAYLQRLSLLSANCPSPSLRYQAHSLISEVLRKHRSDEMRLAFIKDTLENCPYENLKASAVGWMKDETLRARSAGEDVRKTSLLFSSPIALESVASTMFPDLTLVFALADAEQRWMMVKTNLSFYLAALNFYLLLLTSNELREQFPLRAFHSDNDIGGRYVEPLRDACKDIRKDLQGEGDTFHASQGYASEAVMIDLTLLEDALHRVDQGILDLNEVA